jgi:hypothetical protein
MVRSCKNKNSVKQQQKYKIQSLKKYFQGKAAMSRIQLSDLV